MEDDPGELLDEVKRRMAAEIDRRADRLLEVSHAIHAHPELNFEERFAHDLICDVMASEGIDHERRAYGLDTAFVGRSGERGPHIAVCLEYDALPGIGHACGHNIIAAAGLGAGIAAASLATACGGRVSIVGTPAEEGGGGKVFMLREGAFDGIDAAVMLHPADTELSWMTTLAVQQCTATYTGLAAHASAAPEQGRNALDAAVLGYVNVAALRQHIRPAERIHGIFTDGGGKPNIVPSRAETHWFIRSETVAERAVLAERVAACLEAGAVAAGCDVDIDWIDPPYADMVDNRAILTAYADNAHRLGRAPAEPDDRCGVTGSTDMGDVSHAVPSIQPMIRAADEGVAIHTAAFARFAAGASGDRAVIDGAKAMAWTVADLWLRPDLLAAAKDEFARAGSVRTD